MLQGSSIVRRRFAKIEKQSELYSTAEEFARILGVRKYTLFHYDEVGLFSSTLKEENGCRYYFIWQIDIFKVIHALRRLGMSLGGIKEYMENRSPERFVPMTDRRKRQIDEEIRRLRGTKRSVLHGEELMQLAMKAALNEPRLVERGREYLLVSDISTGSERKVAVEIAEHARMQEKYHDTADVVGSIYLGGDMDRGTYDHHVKVYTRLDKKTTSRRVQSRSEGVHVELYGRGHLWDMERSYHLISAFAGEWGIRLGQTWYEDLMLDELMVKECKQHIVKVMAPMESKVMNLQIDRGCTRQYSVRQYQTDGVQP